MAENGEPRPEAATTIDRSASRTGAGDVDPASQPIPTQIGRYRIIDVLGEGGMGVVYRARDPELDRDVAVKVVRASRRDDSSNARERALREGQALARLSHPNVVEVYDVGVYDGRMFIAMELIHGQTLSRWRQSTPPWRAVLDAYLAAGEALAAAHAVGLVHRDFKPHNVMLTERGEVKVLDFGLVRLEGAPATAGMASAGDASDAELTSQSVSALDVALTTTGTFLGTPAYMAAEQFKGRAGDALSDQFSFCVGLWEGLYGERPFAGATVADLRHSISRGEIRPAPHGDAPAGLRDVLRVGLHADPKARFENMPALLSALRRAGTRSQGWGALVLGAIAFAVGVTVWSAASSVTEPCQGAALALGSTWDEPARTRTHDAVVASGRAYTKSTWTLLARRLDAWTASWTQSHTAVCRATQVDGTQSQALLDQRMACLERARVRAAAFLAVLAEGSEDAVRGAVAAAADLPAPEACRSAGSTDTAPGSGANDVPLVAQRAAELHVRLDEARARTVAAAYADALQIALGVGTEARALGDTGLVLDALLVESDLRGSLGEPQAAEATLREAFLLAVESDDAARAAKAARALVFVAGVDLARHDEALEWHRHARAQLDRLAEPDPIAEAALLSNLGAVQGNLGRFAESTNNQLRALALERGALPEGDVRTIPTYANVATALINEGRHEEATRYAEEAVRLTKANLGDDHPDVAFALGIVGVAYRAQGDDARATEATDRAHAITVANYGDDHLFTARSLTSMAKSSMAAQHPDDALQYFERALPIYRTHLGEDHAEFASALHDTAGALFQLQRYDDGVEMMRRAVAIREHVLGENSPELAADLNNLATALRETGGNEEAIGLYQRALAIGEAVGGEQASAAVFQANLALALHGAQRLEDADAAYTLAIAAQEKSGGEGSLLYREVLSGRAEVMLVLARPAEALQLLRRAERWWTRDAEVDGGRERTSRAHFRVQLASAIWESDGDADEAAALADGARSDYAAAEDEDGVAAVDRMVAQYGR